jgi:hypothetical protein
MSTHAGKRSATDATMRLRSIALPVNVAGATLAKQADLWPCGSVNTGTISSRVF